MVRALVIVALLAGASALTADFSDEAWKNRPVSKVINLLKDMSAELEHEAEADGEMYDKLACWCQTNDKEKTKAIADAETRITDLQSAIEEYTAKSSTLTVDIKKLDAAVAENTEALNKATEIREKESADFVASEKDMIQSITSLKGAVIAMSKTHGEALVQRALPRQLLLEVRSKLQKLHSSGISPRLRRHALALIQDSQPQSGAIFGILKQMKETFEKNLASAQKDEAGATEEYKELKSGKEAELEAASSLATNKRSDLAAADENCAASKQDLKDTRAQLAADSEFLANLKTKCESMDREFEARSKTRQDEIAAVSETIGILNDDDAKDTFSKSLGFVQLGSRSSASFSPRLRQASLALHKAGAVAGDLRLIQLSSRVRQDPMAAVKESVGKMVDDLKQQKADESKERDQCNEDLHLNEKTTAEKENNKSDLQSTIADLDMAVQNLKDDIAALNAEIADGQTEMKRASENREKENAEFQQTIADQRATQTILAKALKRLQAFYNKKAALVQQAPPGEFGEYKKSGGAGGVLAMLEKIVEDSKRMESDGVAAEQESQAGYEAFITDSNKAIAAAQADISSKQEEMAKRDGERLEADGDRKGVEDELMGLKELEAQLHAKCDFLVKNFELRQASLDQEIEALRQSNAILSGAGSS